MRRAILLLGHGSRAPGANDAMYALMDRLAQKTGIDIVEAGFMELCEPDIEKAIDTCVGRGADTILVVPYFLHMGLHVQEDLPDIIEAGQRRHPGVRIVLGPHIGYHDRLVDILADRVHDAEQRLPLWEPPVDKPSIRIDISTARPGLTLLKAGQQQGLALKFRCQKAECGRCRVQVIDGGRWLAPPNEAERDRIGDEDIAAGFRLACQAALFPDAAAAASTGVEKRYVEVKSAPATH